MRLKRVMSRALSAERCRLRAGVEFRFHFQIEVGNADVFVQTVDRLFGSHADGGQDQYAEQQKVGFNSHGT